MPTTVSIKEQLNVLTALKTQYKAVRAEWAETSSSERAAELRDESTRLQNLIYDASQDFEKEFHDTFGIYPRELGEATASHGYVLSKKYPTKQQREWSDEDAKA